MAGIKLRMPAGDAWQLLGRSLGANPTPLAFAETYTALQTGAVDGQDNPLPNVQAVKFYEVMSQIVLTSHLIAFDVLCMNEKTWNAAGPDKQKKIQAAADKALAWSVAEHLKREAELADSFKKQGLEINTPDINAFRTYAQKVYLESDEAKAWAPGILDKIAASSSGGVPRALDRLAALPDQCRFGALLLNLQAGGVCDREYGETHVFVCQQRRRLDQAPRGERRCRPARHHVRRVHHPDRLPLRLQLPIGWSSELSVITWLYMTLLGSAFWLKESEEVRFDLISDRLGPLGRRAVGLVVAVAAVILFGMALPATVSYVAFMKVESTSYLKIRLDILYSVYVIFAVAVVVRYLWAIVSLLRGEAPEVADITKASSGL